MTKELVKKKATDAEHREQEGRAGMLSNSATGACSAELETDRSRGVLITPPQVLDLERHGRLIWTLGERIALDWNICLAVGTEVHFVVDEVAEEMREAAGLCSQLESLSLQ